MVRLLKKNWWCLLRQHVSLSCSAVSCVTSLSVLHFSTELMANMSWEETCSSCSRSFYFNEIGPSSLVKMQSIRRWISDRNHAVTVKYCFMCVEEMNQLLVSQCRSAVYAPQTSHSIVFLQQVAAWWFSILVPLLLRCKKVCPSPQWSVLPVITSAINSFYYGLSANTAYLVRVIWLARTSPTITPPGYEHLWWNHVLLSGLNHPEMMHYYQMDDKLPSPPSMGCF